MIRRGIAWLVLLVLAGMTVATPTGSARTVVHFPSIESLGLNITMIGGDLPFPECLMVLGDGLNAPNCRYNEGGLGDGEEHEVYLYPSDNILGTTFNWTKEGCLNSFECVDDFAVPGGPQDGNATYLWGNLTSGTFNLLNLTNGQAGEDIACGIGFEPWVSLCTATVFNSVSSWFWAASAGSPGGAGSEPNVSIELLEYGVGPCDSPSSFAMTLDYANYTVHQDTTCHPWNASKLEAAQLRINATCAGVCDPARVTAIGATVNFTHPNYRGSVVYDWVGLSRLAPTGLTLTARLAFRGTPAENFTAEIYNWTANAYDPLGVFSSSSYATLTFIAGSDTIATNGTLRVRLLDSSVSADEIRTRLIVDYAAVTQEMPSPAPPPSPLLDWMLILLLLILWVSFCAIGAAKSSGLLFMGGSLCGIILAFFFVLPAAELPGIAVLGLAMTCMLGGVGIAISPGGEAG